MHTMKRWRRLLVAVMTVVVVVVITCLQMSSSDLYYAVDTAEVDYVTGEEIPEPVPYNWRGLSEAEMSQLSALGRRLFLGNTSAPGRPDRNFTILVWKHGPQLERRHIRQFGAQRHDPFAQCSVRNCRLTYDSAELERADAVLFHLHRTPGRAFLPPKTAAHAHQRWVFLTDENPHHTFTMSGASAHARLADFDGLFNWSMTYRMDSDVPVPSGRALPGRGRRRTHNKTKLAAIMISNCDSKNRRWEYVKQLRAHLDLDVYGDCGNLRCEGHFDKDCPRLNDYKFYLAFENGDCREYLTEKLWWNAYHKESVPVIMGASLEDCGRLLPPGSYLHVRNFSSPASLARYLQYLHSSPTDYEQLFRWRARFRVVNEHGYFQSPVFHYCRLCEALNYNDAAPKVYNRLEDFWSKTKDCYDPVI